MRRYILNSNGRAPGEFAFLRTDSQIKGRLDRWFSVNNYLTSNGRVTQELDVTALEQALGDWVQGETLPGHVAIDGKRLRGSATGQPPGTHLLAAFSARLQGVIGQLRVDPDANEITAALKLLKTLPLAGVTITGDAMFTQRAICKVIIDGGGDYFFTVKGNQPALKADIAQAFRPFSPLGGMVSAG
jgi:Transposase DDE domain